MEHKYFTKDGKQALINRLNTLIKIYETNDEYPFNKNIFGFIPLSIQSREANLYMINELRQILGIEKISLILNDHGRKKIIEVK